MKYKENIHLNFEYFLFFSIIYMYLKISIMLNKSAKFIVNDNNEHVSFISFANAIKYCKIMNIPISTILIIDEL